MSTPATQPRSVVIERDIPFPAAKIWRALTEPHLIEAWLMQTDFKPLVDHRFRFRADWGAVDCQVLASSRTRRCLIHGRLMVSKVPLLGRSPRPVPARTCAWSSRASEPISSRPTRAPSTAGNSSWQSWIRFWRKPSELSRQSSKRAKLYRADCHGDGSLRRIDDRNTERGLERRSVSRHAGASHDHHIGAVPVA